jgi:hypothetical protein
MWESRLGCLMVRDLEIAAWLCGAYCTRITSKVKSSG